MRRLADRINTLKEVTGASSSCGWMFDEVAMMVYAFVKMFRPGLVIQTGHILGEVGVRHSGSADGRAQARGRDPGGGSGVRGICDTADARDSGRREARQYRSRSVRGGRLGGGIEC